MLLKLRLIVIRVLLIIILLSLCLRMRSSLLPSSRIVVSWLDDVLHPDASDEPVTLTLVVMPHVVLTKKSEPYRIPTTKLFTSVHDPIAIPSTSPTWDNWNGKKPCTLLDCILTRLRWTHNNGTFELKQTGLIGIRRPHPPGWWCGRR
jgi:hypothetical protein